MVDFTLYILKVNLLAAVLICLVYVLSKFVKKQILFLVALLHVAGRFGGFNHSIWPFAA